MTIYQCPRHGDYERIAVNVGDPQLMQRLPGNVWCSECKADAAAAEKQAQAAYDGAMYRWQRWEDADLPYRYRNRTLDNWTAEPAHAATKRALQAWAGHVRDRYDDGEGLLLMGPPGVGKTHLLAGLVTAVIGAGFKARYASWPEVWARCRPPYDGNPEVLLRELGSVDFLALDEIGVRAGTAKEQERLFELIDSRYSRQLPTLVATNLTDGELNKVGERTADRLREACVGVVLAGASKRTDAATARALRAAPEPYEQPEVPTLVLTCSVNGEDQERQWRARAA